MFLLELVMQGVRGFREMVRLRFQSGFNFIYAGNESGKTTSVDTILRLLFPDGQATTMESLVSRQTPDASRGALVLSSDQGAYYRVIQDFAKRAVNFSEYSPSTKEFKLMQKDWDRTAQFMAGMTAGMSEAEYASLFFLRREQGECRDVPSGSPVASPAAVAHSAPPAAPVERSPEQEKRLQELREQLRRAEQAGDADYQLESAKFRLEELSKKLDTLEELNAKYADIESNLASLKGCETLPENLSELLDAHEERQKDIMVKCDELKRDIEGLDMQLAAMPKNPFWKDALFLGGTLIGGASVVAGLFILSEEQADLFPVGMLVSLGLMVTGWYKSSRKNTQRRMVKKEKEQLETDLEEVEKSFEDGGTAIMVYMHATGSQNTEELKDKADNYRYFSSTLLRDIADQRNRLLEGVTVESLRAEHQAAQQEVIELEKVARAQSQDAVDTMSIRQEIERLEGSSTEPAWDFGAMGGGVDFSSDVGALEGGGFGGELETTGKTAAGQQGLFLPELTIASRVGGIEMETLVPAVEAAAQRNLTAVTMGRYLRVDAGHDSEPILTDRDHQQVRFTELSHSTKQLLYFCLRTGLAEALAGKLSMPFILDDPLAGFDPVRQQEACKILRSLAKRTQVILFTSNPALRTEGDAVAELT